jgi:hypothetical protein
MIHVHVLWVLKNGLKTTFKMGHFVSVENFNVWRTHWVGSGQFFSTKLSGHHIGI